MPQTDVKTDFARRLHTPLCAGGADAPHNMQWQTVPDAAAKDRLERAQCAKPRAGGSIDHAENIFAFRTFGA